IWAPNVIWQATHGWPQLAMASVLHQLNSTPANRLTGPAIILAFAGLLVIPLLVAGFVRLWRTPELRFLAITSTLLVGYVLAWVPGKTYYAEGTAPALLASAAVAAEGWIARGRRPGVRRRLVVAAPLVSIAISAPSILPIVPVAYLHDVPSLDKVTTADTFGGSPRRTRPWPGPGRRLPRSSPATTARPACWTCSARPATCRRCSPATTTTGSGARARPPTASCSWSTRLAGCAPISPTAACSPP